MIDVGVEPRQEIVIGQILSCMFINEIEDGVLLYSDPLGRSVHSVCCMKVKEIILDVLGERWEHL